MKNQQQVLLALLLLALTSMSAVAGGMNVAEPFFDEHPENEEEIEEVPVDGEMPVGGEDFSASPDNQVVATSVDKNEDFVQNAVLTPGGDEIPNANVSANAETSNANPVEGFTGGMYAGF